MSEREKPRELEKYDTKRALRYAFATFVLLSLLSVLVVRSKYQAQNETANLEFQFQADRVKREVERRLSLPTYGLIGARGLYEASKSVERNEFRAYVHSRDLKSEFIGIRGIGFIQRVQRENLDLFIESERKDDAPDFVVKTSGNAPDLFVIKYIYPLDQNQAAWGFDVGSESNRRAAALRAITTGSFALTQWVTLVQDENQSPGYLLMLPVYKNGTNPITPEERLRDLAGLVYCPLVVSELMQGVAATTKSQVDFELFDDTIPTVENMVFDADQHLVKAKGVIKESHFSDRLFNASRNIEVGGRTLVLRISTAPEFEEQINLTSTYYFAIGCGLLCILASWTVWLLTSGRERAVSLADSMTKTLKASKESAEEALRENTILLNAINIHAIVSVTDPKGTIVSANQAFSDISGYSNSELVGQDHRIVNSGHHPREFWTDMWRTVTSGKTWHGLVCNRNKDGRLYWVESSIFPIINSEGRIDRFMSIRNDATARVEQAALLQQTAERLESAIDGTYDGLWDWKVGTNEVWYSPRFWALLGFNADNTPPPVFSSFQERLHPDDAERVQKAIESHLECEVQYDIEYRLKHATGGYRWFRARGDSKRDASGKALRLAGSLQDIHDRKLAEIQLKESEASLARAELISGVGSWRMDLQTMRPEWSPQTCRIHEVAEGTQVTLEQAIEFYSPEVRNELRASIEACIANGTKWDLEMPFVTAKGRRLWVRCLGEREVLDGKPTRLFGTIQDVTEKKRARDEMSAMNASLVEQTRLAREMAEQAKAAADAKSLFLATMSHEIRTPMNGVIGMTDLLSGTELSEEQKDFVSSIRVSGEALLGIINDVLDFSKIEAGKISIENMSFEPVRIIEDVLDIVSIQTKEKMLDVIMEVAPNVPERCTGDAIRLRQIVLNLVSNAVKFTASGMVHISIGVESKTEAGTLLKFIVKDTGIGIRPDAATKLFNPFTQSDASITRRFGGTGLGLAICKRLTELMGGNIGMNSRPGEGSQFWFTSLVGIEGSASVMPKHPANLCCILIAEPSTHVRNSLLAQFNHWGIDAVGSSSLQETEEALSKGRDYSFILADEEYAEAILKSQSALGSSAKIVVLTNKTSVSSQIKPAKILTKPVKASALLSILNAAPKKREILIDHEKLNAVMALFAGDERERLRQVAELVLKDAKPQINKCVTAAEKRDGLALEQSSHAIKGIASELGASALAELARNIMTLARESELDKAISLVPQLQNELEKVCDFLTGQPKRSNSIPRPTMLVAGVGMKRKVLVVDDIAMNRKLLNTILDKAGCEVSEASNGIEALSILNQSAFDVIFMDVMMPEMDGIEVVKRLRKGTGPNANSLVVGVSASISSSDQASCLAAGMNAFVAKPIDRKAIVKIVEDMAAIES